MYIYTITNLENNKVYVGQTVQSNPKMRWYSHLADARRGKKSYLLDSIRKYGIEKFEWKVIDTASSVDTLNEKELYWVEKYKKTTIVYNNRQAGNNKLHSQKSIEKMRKIHKARHANNNIGGWTRRDGGPMKGKTQPKSFSNNSKNTWLQKYGVTNPSLVPYSCEYCGKKGKGLAGYKRWHGYNCRNKGAPNGK